MIVTNDLFDRTIRNGVLHLYQRRSWHGHAGGKINRCPIRDKRLGRLGSAFELINARPQCASNRPLEQAAVVAARVFVHANPAATSNSTTSHCSVSFVAEKGDDPAAHTSSHQEELNHWCPPISASRN